MRPSSGARRLRLDHGTSDDALGEARWRDGLPDPPPCGAQADGVPLPGPADVRRHTGAASGAMCAPPPARLPPPGRGAGPRPAAGRSTRRRPTRRSATRRQSIPPAGLARCRGPGSRRPTASAGRTPKAQAQAEALQAAQASAKSAKRSRAAKRRTAEDAHLPPRPGQAPRHPLTPRRYPSAPRRDSSVGRAHD